MIRIQEDDSCCWNAILFSDTTGTLIEALSPLGGSPPIPGKVKAIGKARPIVDLENCNG